MPMINTCNDNQILCLLYALFLTLLFFGMIPILDKKTTNSLRHSVNLDDDEDKKRMLKYYRF